MKIIKTRRHLLEVAAMSARARAKIHIARAATEDLAVGFARSGSASGCRTTELKRSKLATDCCDLDRDLTDAQRMPGDPATAVPIFIGPGARADRVHLDDTMMAPRSQGRGVPSF